MTPVISLKRAAIIAMTVGTFLTFLMFYPRSVAETIVGVDAIRLLRGVTLIAIAGLGGLVSLARFDIGWVRTLTRGPFGWYVLYATWALLSVSFSGDPFLSAAKVFELGVSIFVVALAAHSCTTDAELDRLWVLCMWGIGIVLAGYVVVSVALAMPLLTLVDGFPKYSGFGGGPGGANGMSQISAMLALFGISRGMAARSPEQKLGHWGLTGIAGFALVLSYSRTSMVIFVLLLSLLLVQSRRYIGLILVGGLAMTGALAFGPQLVQFILRGQSTDVFLSLTGRIDYLWVAGLAVWAGSPWIGHGYYYATTYLLPLALVDGYDVTLSNVDNTFLEVAMNLGVVGLMLFAGVWVSVGRKTWVLFRQRPKAWRTPMVREASLLIIATFIRSWVNPTIAYHHWNTFLFLVAALVVTRAVGPSVAGRAKTAVRSGADTCAQPVT